MKNINRWIFKIPVNDIKTTDKDTTLGHKGGECCFLCGKPIKGTPLTFIHLLTSNEIISTDTELDEREDQGFFPIGSECKNNIPNNFYFNLQNK